MSNEIIVNKSVEELVAENKLNYSYNINLFRSFPNVSDGLKVVQRRIMYTCYLNKLTHKSPYVKSAKVVGDCMGSLHAHGDLSLYKSAVSMAQGFYTSEPLIDGYGNFGSVTEPEPAAPRYTEMRFTKYGYDMMDCLNKNSVNWVDNYLGSMKEPLTLPVKYPNLLINGSHGIGQGYMSSLPPHNAGDVIDMTIRILKNEDITLEEVAKGIRPDYPTGCDIITDSTMEQAYLTGRGKVVVRGNIEHDEDKHTLTITSIPYMTTLNDIKDKILDQLKTDKVQGISQIYDESNNKTGYKLILQVKKNYPLDLVEQQLYKFTNLQSTLTVSMMATEDDREFRYYNIKELFTKWIEYRKTTLKRVFNYELSRIRKRSHLLEGFLKAIKDIDLVVQIVKTSDGKKDAVSKLMECDLEFSAIQANYIAEMELYRISALTSMTNINSELASLEKELNYYLEIFVSKEKLKEYIIKELEDGKKSLSHPRKTNCYDVSTDCIVIEDKDYMLFITSDNKIKKVDMTINTQNRAGKGKSINKDQVYLFSGIVNSKENLMLFTDKGRVFSHSVNDLSTSKESSKGFSLSNILKLDSDESVVTVLNIKSEDNKDDNCLIFFTSNGLVKRTSLEHYRNIRKSGLIALKLFDNDKLVNVSLNKSDSDKVLIVTEGAKATQFKVNDVNLTLRDTSGVKGITLSDDDRVINSSLLSEDDKFIVLVSQNGLGKKLDISEIPEVIRGAKGVMVAKLRDNDLLSSYSLSQIEDSVIVMTTSNIIKLEVKDIPTLRRPTIGVKLIDIKEGDKVSLCING